MGKYRDVVARKLRQLRRLRNGRWNCEAPENLSPGCADAVQIYPAQKLGRVQKIQAVFEDDKDRRQVASFPFVPSIDAAQFIESIHKILNQAEPEKKWKLAASKKDIN